MKTKNNFKSITILCLVLFAIFSISAFAQKEDSKKLKEKIKEIKGDINKITIIADGKTHEFIGEDAKKLFKKLKSDRVKKFKVNIDGDDESLSNIWVMSDDDNDHDIRVFEHGGKNLMFITEELEGDGEVEKEVKVEIDDDGKKKITVKTTKDGEETTKVYEGDEADEYFGNMKGAKKMHIDILDDDDNELIWIGEGDGAATFLSSEMMDGDKIIKKINVTKEDGETKVVVTTTKDGEDTEEVYEGDEAEEYLKKIHKGKKFNEWKDDDVDIYIMKDGDVTIKKIGEDEKIIKVKVKKGDKKTKMKKIIIKKKKDDDEKEDKE